MGMIRVWACLAGTLLPLCADPLPRLFPKILRKNARAVSKAIADNYSIPKSRQGMIEGIRKRQDDLDSTGISDKDAMKYINMLYEGI